MSDETKNGHAPKRAEDEEAPSLRDAFAIGFAGAIVRQDWDLRSMLRDAPMIATVAYRLADAMGAARRVSPEALATLDEDAAAAPEVEG